ncbi:WD repeats-containing protein [Cryptosporidium ubiquitum]|uniref:WD repeats-containing protein n=1 Tax=Cryptosporidium ubiquitum TaxID=857276 RepID=A0A1J4MLW7_9CRYT|nr:WD repeats-containing protein [Cryptosporidium ubiquitum]OII75241.1 WD repeats-containing protein [Cryptosporidium ubiquitum]
MRSGGRGLISDENEEIPIKLLRKLTKNETILSLEFIKFDNTLISGNISGVLDIWDLEIMRCTSSINIGFGSPIIKTIYDDKREIIYVQNRKGEVYLVDQFENIRKMNLIGTDYSLAKMIILPRSENVIFPRENDLLLKSLETSKNEEIIFNYPTEKSDKLIDIESLNDNSVLLGFESGNVVIWDLRKPDSHAYMNNVTNNSPILSIKRSFNRLWISSFDSKLRIFNRNCFDYPIKEITSLNVIDKISVRSDSLITVTSNTINTSMDIFENKSLERIKTFKFHSTEVSSIQFSNISNLFAASSNTISIWDLLS